MKKFHLNNEEKFILNIVILVIAFLCVRHAFMLDTEHQVETAYETGYACALEDVVEMTTVVSTYEKDGNCYIVLELPNGEEHLFVSPAAKG